MKRILVTGAAGFIGSHLCEALLDRDGVDVVGVDAFIPYYPRALKEVNLDKANLYDHFEFHELDLRTDSLEACVCDCDTIVHLAAH